MGVTNLAIDTSKLANPEHPTIRRVVERGASDDSSSQSQDPLDTSWLRELALKAGVDDVGFVSLDAPALGEEAAQIRRAYPAARALISLVARSNREDIRNPARSVANVEMHETIDQVIEAGRTVVRQLENQGIRAWNTTPGFPMEADRWPERMWVVSHKVVAVAAGMGQMGLNRNVIHPRYGSVVMLGTVVLDRELSAYTSPIDYNPCVDCKLCVAACPTGAITPDGHFNFQACYTHNYREFMGGFGNWVETIAGAGSAASYRKQVSDSETVSMWQSLSFGANYKAAYCVAVCPAGEDVITPFLADRKHFLDETVRPLQQKDETIYVIPGSDAEQLVPRRFPSKRTKRVSSNIRPRTLRGFLAGLPLLFQREQAQGLDATYHFTFTGDEERLATIEIRSQSLRVEEGHVGVPDLRVTADSTTWIEFVAKQRSIVGALLRGKIRLRGSPRLLLAFGKCFPS